MTFILLEFCCCCCPSHWVYFCSICLGLGGLLIVEYVQAQNFNSLQKTTFCKATLLSKYKNFYSFSMLLFYSLFFFGGGESEFIETENVL